MNDKKRVLITGATGFVGTHLLYELIQRVGKDFHSIVSLSRKATGGFPLEVVEGELHSWMCDLTRPIDVLTIFEKYQPDIIFHLAANSAVSSNNKVLFENNLKSTFHLTEFCPKNCRIVFASSATVYSNYDLECGANEVMTPKPDNFYGLAKLTGEHLVRLHGNSISLRLVANVGPKCTHGCVKDFVDKLSGPSEVLEVWGTSPGSRKPYLYVRDTARALLHVGLSCTQGEFNLGHEDTLSIKQVAEIVMDELSMNRSLSWSSEAGFVGDNDSVRPACYKFNMVFPDFKWLCTTSKDSVRLGASDYYKEISLCRKS